MGETKLRLTEHLLTQEDKVLEAMAAVFFDDALFVKGESETLPWVDGIRYLGIDPDAPRLWIPTHTKPNVALGIFAAAIQKHAGIAGPLAVSLFPKRTFPVGDSHILTRASLMAHGQ